MWLSRKAHGKPALERLEERDCPSYSVVDLGSLGGVGAAEAINATGQVVGESQTLALDQWGNRIMHAFLWQQGSGMADLGSLGGLNSEATAINSSTQVVGNAETGAADVNGHPLRHAFLWQPSVGMVDLGTLGGPASGATAINNSGQVVGGAQAINPDGTTAWHGFLWQNGVMTDLNSNLPANSGWVLQSAQDVNDSGQITGYGLHNGHVHAYLLAGNAVTDLGAIGTYSGSNYSAGYALNNAGQVVGESTNSASSRDHAFIDIGGKMADLGALNSGKTSYSTAKAINEAGQAVGISTYLKSDTTGLYQHAVLWQGGTKTDLNNVLPKNSGWELLRAYGINDAGYIVGVGDLTGHGNHPFLLVPSNSAAPPTSQGTATANATTASQVQPLLAAASAPATTTTVGAPTSSQVQFIADNSNQQSPGNQTPRPGKSTDDSGPGTPGNKSKQNRIDQLSELGDQSQASDVMIDTTIR
jgi:probable HAF family extracellular repeat protein